MARCLALKHQMYEGFLFVFLALLLSFSLLPNLGAYAQKGSLTLEKEQNWAGCIPGGHNVFVKDVDDDDVIEIITGGFTYGGGMLRIWSWDGENLTLEKGHEWNTINRTRVLGVYASDVDGDGDTETVTVGSYSNGTISYAQLMIWRWDGDALILEGGQEWCNVEDAAEPLSGGSVYVCDVDDDGSSEIITGGRAYDGTRFNAQLRIWSWDGDTLVLEKSQEWCAAEEAFVNSVYAYDVDGDGVTEIVTSGFDNDLENSSGQLRIWSWNGETLTLEKSQEWQMAEGTALNIVGRVMGNTIAAAVKISDVDGDGVPEIVTGGFTYDGIRANGQLRIWSWDGETLALEKSHEWYNFNLTEVKSLSIEDVDGDGKQEILASGFVWNGTHGLAQLNVWNWDGKTLALKSSQIWCSGDGACAWNVDAGDVDKDGVTEMVTVGCMIVGIKCSGHLRIWSIPRSSTFPLYGLYVIVATVAILIAFAGAYLYLRKKPKTT